MRRDGIKIIKGRCTENIENDADLMVIVSTREERPTRKHLGQDAADGPKVNGFGVRFEEEDFWCPVPSRSHIFCHEIGGSILVAWWRVRRAGETKVAQLEVTIRIEQEV